jgi:hypothetical protein
MKNCTDINGVRKRQKTGGKPTYLNFSDISENLRKFGDRC